MAHEHRRTDGALKRGCIWVERVQRWARACRERVSVAEDALWRSLERSGLTRCGGDTHKYGPPASSHSGSHENVNAFQATTNWRSPHPIAHFASVTDMKQNDETVMHSL